MFQKYIYYCQLSNNVNIQVTVVKTWYFFSFGNCLWVCFDISLFFVIILLHYLYTFCTVHTWYASLWQC